MANILDRYGIKEVADVTFYALDNVTGKPTHPVLFLDTLKVSTIEQTAESAEARGGKGNAPLIVWDYGKEISVTLEDALFSPKSLAIMFGDKDGSIASKTGYIMKTETLKAKADLKGATGQTYSALIANLEDYKANFDFGGKTVAKTNPKIYDAQGNWISPATSDATTVMTAGETYLVTYDLPISGQVIDVSANSFPGTYYVTGDTYVRSETSGQDEAFQFIIPKAKVTPESNTITLEAEGDPSVFNMNLKVLRPRDGVMMKLVKYELTNDTIAQAADDLIHNHTMEGGATV